MKSDEVLIYRINDNTLQDVVEKEVSKNGKHEVDEYQQCTNISK